MSQPPSDTSGYQRYQSSASVKPERGGCLTLWLVVSSLAAVVGVILLFQTLGLLNRVSGPRASQVQLVLIFAGIFLMIGIACLWGIWNWKKWGVYGVIATGIVSPLLQFLLGVGNAVDCVRPIIQFGVLYFLINDKWDYFD
jgi:hypothetical protein